MQEKLKTDPAEQQEQLETTMVEEQALKEAISVARYLMGSGGKYNEADVATLFEMDRNYKSDKELDHRELIRIHNRLANAVKPSVPRGVLAVEHQPGLSSFFDPSGRLQLTMWGLCAFFLLIFMCLTAKGSINAETLETTFLYREGMEQFQVAVFYVSAAGLGACFFNLITIYRYLIRGTYDPKYSLTYFSRILLGIVAGYMTAELITINTDLEFTKPLLAMLGGFSADAFESILKRFVDTLKTLVQGSAETLESAKLESQKAALNQQALRAKMEQVTELQKFKNDINDPKLSTKLDELIKKVLDT